MPENDVTQISSNGYLVGIIVPQNITVALTSYYSQQSYKVIGEEMVRRKEVPKQMKS